MVHLNFIQSLQPSDEAKFRNGDKVVLAKGTYQGTWGIFLKLRDDPNWADILEQNSQIRSHPVEWLQYSIAD